VTRKLPLPRQQVFYVTSKTTCIDKQTFVYVEADRWYDARELTYSIYGPNDFWMENQTKTHTITRHNYNLHLGNWWLVTWTGNAANNTLERVVWRYTEPGKRVRWVGSSSVTRTGAIAAGE
jgi:hypothetical protein